jgi:hypothetical protein
MPTVLLAPDGTTRQQPTRLPRRFLLSTGDVEALAALTGTRLPWAQSTESASQSINAGLLSPLGDVHPEAAGAMAVFAAPQVVVDLDLAVRRAGGGPRLHSWQRFNEGVVTSLSTALTGRFELAWYDAALWQTELARALTLPGAAARQEQPDPPAEVMELPFDLLIGTGEALATNRADIFDELVGREADSVTADGQPLGPAAAHEQVHRLHTATTARLQVVGSGTGSAGDRRIGWVSWLRFADGWRALTPRVDHGRAMVRLEPRDPLDLGNEVAHWVTQVRS